MLLSTICRLLRSIPLILIPINLRNGALQFVFEIGFCTFIERMMTKVVSDHTIHLLRITIATLCRDRDSLSVGSPNAIFDFVRVCHVVRPRGKRNLCSLF